ncbi:MAG: extracellular solute-binding protein, partial [Candidatus Aenigmatarchaeota archaeon]
MGEEKKINRRDYLKYTGAAIGGLVVGGALGYLAKPAEVVEKTATVTVPGIERTVTVTAPGIERTVTITATAPVTKTITTPTTETVTTPIIKPGKISFMNMGGIATDILNEMVVDFKKKFPGSDVVLDNVPHAAGHEKYLTLFKGGTPPDIGYFLELWVPEFAEMNALVALDEFLGPAEWKKISDEFIGNTEELCLWKGKHYGIPMYYSTRAMLYRKDKLEEVGFKIPAKDGWSYETLYEAVKAIHKPEIGFYGFGMPLKDPKHTLRVFVQVAWPRGL